MKHMRTDVVSITHHCETHATIKKRYTYGRLKIASSQSTNTLTILTLFYIKPIANYAEERNNQHMLTYRYNRRYGQCSPRQFVVYICNLYTSC